MEKVKLEAQIREELGKTRTAALRREGFIPAVVYGQKRATQSIKLRQRDFLRFLHSHGAENVIINLSVLGGTKKQKESPVLIKEIQFNPLTEDVVHIDFHQISLTEEIKVKIPIVAKGEPIGVKQDDGVLDHILWELEIECLPTDMPKDIEVDVSNLNIGDDIHVKDLNLSPKIKVLVEPEAVVLSVSPPTKVEEVVPEEAEAVAEEAAEPEVIKEKKEGEAEEAKPAAEKGKPAAKKEEPSKTEKEKS